jgi:hypothetical protein
MKEYKPQMIQIEDAIRFHLELAHESMFNNMNGFMFARLILDMTTKKKVFDFKYISIFKTLNRQFFQIIFFWKAKFMDNIKGFICFPNHFEDGIAKEVIAICKVILILLKFNDNKTNKRNILLRNAGE